MDVVLQTGPADETERQETERTPSTAVPKKTERSMHREKHRALQTTSQCKDAGSNTNDSYKDHDEIENAHTSNQKQTTHAICLVPED